MLSYLVLSFILPLITTFQHFSDYSYTFTKLMLDVSIIPKNLYE